MLFLEGNLFGCYMPGLLAVAEHARSAPIDNFVNAVFFFWKSLLTGVGMCFFVGDGKGA